MSPRLKPLVTSAVGVAVVLCGLWFMARSSGGQTENTFSAEFDNVVGLANNSQVLYRGVKVGEVVSIDVKEGSGGSVAVLEVQLQEDADIELTEEASLVLRLKSILGELFLDLDPGSSPEPYDTSKPLTNTHRDTSLDQLLFQGAALYNEVSAAQETKSIADQVRSLLETSGDDLNAITENSKLIVEGLASRVDSMTHIIQNLDILTASTDGKAAELGVAIDDVNRTLRGLRETLSSNSERIKNLLASVNELIASADLARLDEQLARLPEYVEKLDHGLLVLRSFLQHRIPLWSTAPTFQPNNAPDSLRQVQAIRDANPFAARLLADFLEALFYQ